MTLNLLKLRLMLVHRKSCEVSELDQTKASLTKVKTKPYKG